MHDLIHSHSGCTTSFSLTEEAADLEILRKKTRTRHVAAEAKSGAKALRDWGPFFGMSMYTYEKKNSAWTRTVCMNVLVPISFVLLLSVSLPRTSKCNSVFVGIKCIVFL